MHNVCIKNSEKISFAKQEQWKAIKIARKHAKHELIIFSPYMIHLKGKLLKCCKKKDIL